DGHGRESRHGTNDDQRQSGKPRAPRRTRAASLEQTSKVHGFPSLLFQMTCPPLEGARGGLNRESCQSNDGDELAARALVGLAFRGVRRHRDRAKGMSPDTVPGGSAIILHHKGQGRKGNPSRSSS